MKIIKELTPKCLSCAIGACPAIFKTDKGTYILIGSKLNSQKVGLKDRTGKGEVVIEIPSELLEDFKK